VKFGSSITLLKQCIVKGMALSLICVAGVVEAAPVIVNVTVNTDGAGPPAGSLRAAVNTVNANDPTPTQNEYSARYQLIALLR